MQMSETARMIEGLRRIGWTDTQINELVLYIETGNEEHIEKLEQAKEA